MTEEKKYTGLNCPDYKTRVLTRRIERTMREFLDVSSSTGHLEVYRRDLNDLMGKFIEVQSDKRNPHIIEDFELEERKVNMEAEETLSKLLMTELEERKAKFSWLYMEGEE
mgnify:FL=1